MKKPNLLTLLSQMLLTFLIGLSGIGCMATAFELPVSPGPILLSCAFFAILTALLPSMRRGWLAVLVAMALWGRYFWKQDVVASLLSLVKYLLQIYRMAYDWDIPGWISGAVSVDITLALMLIVAVCTLLAGLSLACGRASGAILALLLPVVPCFVVIDTVPAEGWLLAMMVCLVLLLMGQNVRNISPQRAAQVVAFLLIPVLLGGWLLLYLNPRDSYQRPSQEENFEDRLLEYVDKLPGVKVEDGQILLEHDIFPQLTFPEQTLTTPTINLGTVDVTLPPVTLDPAIVDIFNDAVSLGSAGPRNPGKTAVMRVDTTFSGQVYLRERGYDLYTGTAWESSGEEQTLGIREIYLDRKARAVTVTTQWTHSNYFIPYYSFIEDRLLEEGKLPNTDAVREYSFTMYSVKAGWKGLWRDYQGLTLAQIEEIGDTELPQSTLDAAKELLQSIGIHEDMLILEAVMRIQNYVRNSAVYDLNTQKMPEEYADFALWFLEESETGYCVHFATAATVLLRAAGIPARYVEGYMVTTNGSETDVRASDAHAWVEYYVPEMGWVIMEATPSSETPPTPPVTTVPTQPATTVPTEPPTTVPTEPVTTVPTEPTTPTEPVTTVPTQPTTTVPATTTVPETSTVAPTTQPEIPPEPPKDLTGLYTALAIVFGILGLGCGLYGQWQLRLWLKQAWLRSSDPNRRAIKLWRESRMYAWLRRQQAPRALRDLAWKAKFSQHTLSDAELDAFLAYHGRSIAHLKTRPWYLQLVYCLVFAAY